MVEKKRGGLIKLMEAIDALGFHLTDISITTSQGALLFTSSAEVEFYFISFAQNRADCSVLVPDILNCSFNTTLINKLAGSSWWSARCGQDKRVPLADRYEHLDML